MSIELQAINWLWEQYGKEIADKALGEAKKKWTEFNWAEAEINYKYRMIELHNTTRLLGNPKPISIQGIYTDVYVLDRLTAFRRFDLAELQVNQTDRDFQIEDGRRPAIDIAQRNMRLFILGKPGAGKTTFLKYLTLQACFGKIKKTPIFISLREWADSGLEIMPFIYSRFEICSFPDTEGFVKNLLENGNAMVLFDGLDEVNHQKEQRMKTIKTISDFANIYGYSQICLTCRIAATDYSFGQFTYLEIADFKESQIREFVKKWYSGETAKHHRFIAEFERPENNGLRELARTPLLLTLLCLAFDELLTFPARRVDLYKEAFDALLKKWDSSRGIKRDEIYKKLSSARKEQLLARIAAQNFEVSKYLIRQEILINQINDYLSQLPDNRSNENLEGEVVLKAIEAQHGIFVERAHGIYSFSHLTFQEYLTARYVVDNAVNGTLYRLINVHFTDSRWQEVLLLTVSILDNADVFFDTASNTMENLIESDQNLKSIVSWANENAIIGTDQTPRSIATNILIAIASLLYQYLRIVIGGSYSHVSQKASRLNDNNIGMDDRLFVKVLSKRLSKSIDKSKISSFNTALDLCYAIAEHYSPDKGLEATITEIRKLSLNLDRAIDKLSFRELKNAALKIERSKFSSFQSILQNEITSSQLESIIQYLRASQLFINCLSIATVTDRSKKDNELLMFPRNQSRSK